MKKLVKFSLLMLLLLNFIYTKAQVVSLPYFNDFETDTTGWRFNLSSVNNSYWNWGTPIFDVDTSAFSGLKAWSAYRNKSSDTLRSYLYSPIFDCSSFSDVDVSFNYRTELSNAQEFVFLEYSIDSGVTWMVAQGGPGSHINWGNFQTNLGHYAWTGSSSIWLSARQSIISVTNSNHVQFRLSITTLPFIVNLGSRFSIDDFTIIGSPSIDLNLSLYYGVNTFLDLANSVSTNFNNLELKNLGKDTIWSFHVGYMVNGNLIKDTLINNMILPGQEISEFVSFNYIVPNGRYDFSVYAFTAGDSIQNDTIYLAGYGFYPIIQIPYFADFDTGAVGWGNLTEGDVNTNWELGSPTFGQTNSTYSGTNAWDINLNTSYSLNALCYLYSPVFNCSNATRIDLSFMQNRNISPQTEIRLEMSLNGGSSWTIIRNLNGYAQNWHSYYWGWNSSNLQWQFCEYKNLLVNNQSNVVFRFVFDNRFNSEIPFDGVSIDDFKITPSLINNVTLVKMNRLSIFGAPGTQSSAIYATIQNRGGATVSGYTVGYSLNGVVGFISAPISTVLNQNDTVRVNLGAFIIPVNLSSICVFVNLLNDENPNDDSLCTDVFIYSHPNYNLPFYDGFESGIVGWKNVGAPNESSVWELGSPNFGVTNSTHSGTNAWDVNLNSAYGPNAACLLYSPFFNTANIDRVDLSLWYNSRVYSGDGVRLDISYNDGVSWNVLTDLDGFENLNWYDSSFIISASLLPAWSEVSFGWKNATLNGVSVNGASRIIFRLVFNSTSFVGGAEGFSFDDFSISATADTNLACVSMTPSDPIIAREGSPLSGVELTIRNLGSSIINSYTIGLSIDNIPFLSIPQSTVLNPGQSINIVLPDLSVPVDASKICGYVSILGDSVSLDDTTCYDINVLNYKVLNYSQNFDSIEVDWSPVRNNAFNGVIYDKWELGTPNYGATNSTFSGPNSWDVNLNSPCLDNVFCDIYSPIFILGNLSIKHLISFKLNYKTEKGWDGVRFDYSTDSSTTWTTLGTINDLQGFNWYTDSSLNSSGLSAWTGNSNGWIQCNYLMSPNQLGSTLLFRFVYTSDASVVSDGVSFDDFKFEAINSVDLGLENFIVTKDTFMVGAGMPVNVRVKNNGAQNVSQLKIGYNHNGNVGTYTQNLTMIPGVSYTISIPNLNILPGKNVLTVYIDDSLEIINWNDTLTLTNYGFERITLPYVDSYEGATPNGWFARDGQIGLGWERGAPNFGVTNSAHSGINAWDIVLDSAYKPSHSDTLYSPVFSTVGMSNLTLSFWINYNVLYGNSGVRLQFKTNAVNAWRNVDTLLLQRDYTGSSNNGMEVSSDFSIGWTEVRVKINYLFQNMSDLRFRLIFSNDFSVAYDGFSIDDFNFSGTTGLMSFSEDNKDDIYPNPTSDWLIIRPKQIGNCNMDLSIFTVDCKLMLNRNLFFSDETSIDVTGLLPGMYLLQLRSENGESGTYKFIKN